ncbi:hypothetical protein PAMA_008469 [Pampus argenteus]
MWVASRTPGLLRRARAEGEHDGVCCFSSLSKEKPTGPNRATAVLTQLVQGTQTPRHRARAPGMFQGLAGETITSAGNRLGHSGFHTGRKPPEPSLSKPTCVGTGDNGGSKTPIQTSEQIPEGPAEGPPEANIQTTNEL